MSGKLVKWDNKIKKQKQHNQNNENKDVFEITKKTKDKFKSLLDANKDGKYFAFIPTLFCLMLFIGTLIYPGFDMNQIIHEELPGLLIIGLWIPMIILPFVLYEEYKYKRLYKQVCDKTIIIKQLPIIKFKRFRPMWNFKFEDEYDRRGKFGYRVIVSDWKKKYKSLKIWDERLWLSSWDTGYLRLDFILEFIKSYKHKDSLTIGKTYYIWDMVTVYIDSKWKNNYYVDI